MIFETYNNFTKMKYSTNNSNSSSYIVFLPVDPKLYSPARNCGRENTTDPIPNVKIPIPISFGLFLFPP